MNRLETYLQQATAGLWGRKRREVIEELRGSIEARVWALEHQGHHADTALEMALRELGDARMVGVAFRQVHWLPVAVRAFLAACLLVVSSVQPAIAQIQAIPIHDQQGNLVSFDVDVATLKHSLFASDDPDFSLRHAFRMHLEQPSDAAVEFSSLLRVLAQLGDVELDASPDTVMFAFQGQRFQLAVSVTDARAWHRSRPRVP